MSLLASIVVWIGTVVGFLLLSHLAYLGSISAASAWGAKVKGAFDLYRNDLLKQLGYDRLPSTLKEEKNLWDLISLRMILRRSALGAGPTCGV